MCSLLIYEFCHLVLNLLICNREQCFFNLLGRKRERLKGGKERERDPISWSYLTFSQWKPQDLRKKGKQINDKKAWCILILLGQSFITYVLFTVDFTPAKI